MHQYDNFILPLYTFLRHSLTIKFHSWEIKTFLKKNYASRIFYRAQKLLILNVFTCKFGTRPFSLHFERFYIVHPNFASLSFLVDLGKNVLFQQITSRTKTVSFWTICRFHEILYQNFALQIFYLSSANRFPLSDCKHLKKTCLTAPWDQKINCTMTLTYTMALWHWRLEWH